MRNSSSGPRITDSFGFLEASYEGLVARLDKTLGDKDYSSFANLWAVKSMLAYRVLNRQLESLWLL